MLLLSLKIEIAILSAEPLYELNNLFSFDCISSNFLVYGIVYSRRKVFIIIIMIAWIDNALNWTGPMGAGLMNAAEATRQ